MKTVTLLIVVIIFAISAKAQCPVSTPSVIDTVCLGDSVTLIAPCPSNLNPSFAWFGPCSYSSPVQSPILWIDTPLVYCIGFSNAFIGIISVAGCNPVYDTTYIYLSPGCIDSIWPGDVNYDHVVDNTDALDLALGYGSTGYTRASASIAWIPQFSYNWGSTILIPGVNMKNADCNGDGIVDVSDTLAISANYGLTHPKGNHHAQPKITGLPDLYFDLTGINPIAGTTISIPIKLGSASLPMNNILGIAAKIHISGITPSGSPGVSQAISWLGNGTNTFSFRKVISANEIDWAYARNDHQNQSGTGTIADLTFAIPSNTGGQKIMLYFDNVRIINDSGHVVTAYNVIDDTVLVQYPTEVFTLRSQNDYFVVTPNPSSHSELRGFIAKQSNLQVKIIDMFGKVISAYMESNQGGNIFLPLASDNLRQGTYLIQVTTDDSIYNLKWIKN